MMKINFCFLLFGTFVFGQNFLVSEISSDLKKNANAVIRKDNTTITINKINDIQYENYSAITVLNKEGERAAVAAIFYNKSNRISDVKVTVYDGLGKKIKSYSKSDFSDQANNSQGSFYSDNRVMHFSYQAASYPYTVEFSYINSTDNTVFIPDFVPFYNTNISLQESNLYIDNKSGIDLRTKIYPSKYNIASVTELNNGAEKAYSYKNIKAINDELYAPTVQQLMPKVSFALSKFNLVGKQGNLSSWSDFGNWYYNSILKPVSDSTPEIKAEVASLNLKGSIHEKVMALFQHMQNKTRYIYVGLGIGGWQPMLPAEVHKKGYGDCKGLTNYMKTLLNEAGIPSYYCVINSNSSPISFDESFPKMGGNHVVLMVPTEKGNIWLENTSQQIAYNHLGFSTTDRNVLAIKENGIEIINTPSLPADKNKEVQKIKVKLSPEGNLSGKSELTYTGSQYDYSLPLVTLSTNERIDFLKNRFDVLNFENLSMSNFNNNKEKAESTFDINFVVNHYAKSVGNSFMFRALPIYARNIFKTDDARELPFEIPQAYQDDYEVLYEFPVGYQLEEIPNNVNLNSEFGSYQLQFKKEDNALVVKRVLTINKGLHPKEKFNDYMNFRKKIMNQDFSKVLISKK